MSDLAAPALSAPPPEAAVPRRAPSNQPTGRGDWAGPEHPPLPVGEQHRPVDPVGDPARSGLHERARSDPLPPARPPRLAGQAHRPVDPIGLAPGPGSNQATGRDDPLPPARQPRSAGPQFAGEQGEPVDPVGSAAAPGVEPDARPLDLARFAQASPDRSALQQKIAQAPPAARARARLELARWFLARAMAPEARAVLEFLGRHRVGAAAAGCRRAVLSRAAICYSGSRESAIGCIRSALTCGGTC